jgi:hypothetical protein
MVFTYTGIVKVLWGSLPTEKLVHDEKRTISASQHTLSGIIIFQKIKNKKYFLTISRSFR